MLGKNKSSQSEIDGVQYRRAKLWQIILVSCNAFVGMGVYNLIGMAAYAGNIGFGVATVTVGVVVAISRIFDGITDPLLAFVYDRVNTRFGKLRILMVAGFLIEAIALLCMYNMMAGKGFGLVTFFVLYIIYVIGYTLTNMTCQTLPAIMTNDPKQRPTIGVYTTVLNYAIPMGLTMLNFVVLMPKFGGYTQEFLATACWVVLGLGALGTLLTCIGISEYDKPENFVGTTKKQEPLKLKDMLDVLAHNRPLQCYIASNASDKLAQQTNSQAVVTTLIFGIVIGDMAMSTTLNTMSMLPSIFCAALGAWYVGRKGSKKGIVTWTWVSMAIAIVTVIFFIVVDPTQIAVAGSLPMFIFFGLNLLQNGSNMCITTANTSYMADCIDYELDRSGKYIPAVVSGTYSLIDKLISSLGAVIATAAVAMIGYSAVWPQPGEPSTPSIFWMGMALKYGMPIVGWIITLVAMKFCALDKEEMVNIQKRIADKKAAARHEVIEENLK